MKLSTQLFIGFALVILFSIIDSVINYKLTQKVNQNTGFLTHSESIIRNSSRLHKGIIEMQSGFRGYLLTGNTNFLQSFYEGLKEIPPLISEQKKLIKGTESQKIKLDSIILLHQKWINYANSLIGAKKQSSTLNGNKEYEFLFENKLKKEVGKKLNDEIKIKFRQFDKYEYQIRQKRREALSTSIQNTHTISLALSLITLLIALITAIYIAKIISSRISKMVNFADAISKGNFKIMDDYKSDELTNLSYSLNIMSQNLSRSFNELEKKNRELDQFAYVVSHDLKAPLRGMYNILIWIEEDLSSELSSKLKDYLKKLSGRIERLESLINGMLEYAKIGRVTKTLENVNIKELLTEITETIVPHDYKVEIGDMPTIKTEKIRLEQVFNNLISNAVKYCNKTDGQIRITYKNMEGYYEFSVADNGTGIPLEYHEKIFGMFQTLREKNETESTGVGLAIVKKIIDEQKGTIKVISESDKGSNFIFSWPKEPI